MNGILIVDKPKDFTSFDVIAKLRGALHERRIGHGGTLDPMATGVLPLFIGSATKAADLDSDTDKRYSAVIRFGLRTDTGDVTGTTLETNDAPVDEKALRKAAGALEGAQLQTPPMYSAVKINGQKLVDLARRGKTVERPARPIEIKKFTVTAYDGGTREASADILCSKGTYIRVLAEDLAKEIGTVAALSQLRRTKSGSFTESDAHGLDDIIEAAKNGEAERLLLPVERLFLRYPAFELTEDEQKPYFNGVSYEKRLPDGLYRAMLGGRFTSLARVENETIKKLKGFFD